MKSIKKREFDTRKIDICINCNGTGKEIERGFDYGHGWSRNEKETVCSICGGAGKVLKVTKGTIEIKALTADEWLSVKMTEL